MKLKKNLKISHRPTVYSSTSDVNVTFIYEMYTFVNCPFINSNTQQYVHYIYVPTSLVYGVYKSKLIRLFRLH